MWTLEGERSHNPPDRDLHRECLCEARSSLGRFCSWEFYTTDTVDKISKRLCITRCTKVADTSHYVSLSFDLSYRVICMYSRRRV